MDAIQAPADSMGPGPLGALPSGYCCESDQDCRGRRCAQWGASPHYCADTCTTDEVCGARNYCEHSLGYCARNSGIASCIPQAFYESGTKATGSCCAGATECLGGWCLDGYCTQGCKLDSDCPQSYRCSDNQCRQKSSPPACT